MSALAYLIAAHLVALAGAASALAKTIQQPDPYRAARSRVLALVDTRGFCLGELALAAALVSPLPQGVQAIAALVLALSVIASEFARERFPQEEPDGFGSLSPRSRAQHRAIGAVVGVAALWVVSNALVAPALTRALDPRITALTLVLLAAIGVKLALDQRHGLGYAPRARPNAAATRLPPDLPLGRDTHGDMTAADIAAAGRSALLVLLSPDSADCRDVYALLNKHAELLNREMLVLASAQDVRLYRDARSTALRRLADPGCHVGRWLGLTARPCAMLVGADLDLLAPPSQTPHTVQRLITLLVTSVQNAPTAVLNFERNDAAPAREPAAPRAPEPTHSDLG